MDAIPEKKFGISGSTLKMIAMISMLLDHIGAAVFENILRQSSYFLTYRAFMGLSPEKLYLLSRAHRFIGRLAFPIFCFLLVEGFFHTKNKRNFAWRLLIFAFLSEIPFDLAFSGKVLDFYYQNVFFTLFLGFTGVWICDALGKKLQDQGSLSLLKYLVLPAAMFLATLLRTDYYWMGVLLIFVMYAFHDRPLLRNTAGSGVLLWGLAKTVYQNMASLSFLNPLYFSSLVAPLAFVPIGRYNKTRGWNLKYVFYLFYPVHLLILYAVFRFFTR